MRDAAGELADDLIRDAYPGPARFSSGDGVGFGPLFGTLAWFLAKAILQMLLSRRGYPARRGLMGLGGLRVTGRVSHQDREWAKGRARAIYEDAIRSVEAETPAAGSMAKWQPPMED